MNIIFTAKINMYAWFVTFWFGEKVFFSYCMSNPKDTYVGLVYHTKQLLMLSRKRCKREALEDCKEYLLMKLYCVNVLEAEILM